jgi:hypothetical protein
MQGEPFLSRRSIRFAGLCALAAALPGCTTTLPAEEAAAFKTIAETDRETLAALSRSELDARVRYAQRALRENDGRVIVDEGCGPTSEGDCRVSYRLGDASVTLVEAVPNVRALMGGIARYGEQMSELAEATDLAEAKGKASAAGGAAKSLLALVFPGAAVVGPIIDAALFAGNASLVTKRRRALLRTAEAADPAIIQAARTLDAVLVPLKDSIIRDASREVSDLQAAILKDQNSEAALRKRQPRKRELTPWSASRIEELQQRRADNLALIAEASRKLNAARAIKPDFQALPRAHGEIIKKLRNPKVSTEDALADLNQMLAMLDSLEAAL